MKFRKLFTAVLLSLTVLIPLPAIPQNVKQEIYSDRKWPKEPTSSNWRSYLMP